MSVEFNNLMNKIAKVVENRTIVLPTARKQKEYEDGYYSPFFSLIDRGGELLCMWCGNRKKPDGDGKGGDVEILRFRNAELGFFTDSSVPKSWDAITMIVYDYYHPKPVAERLSYGR